MATCAAVFGDGRSQDGRTSNTRGESEGKEAMEVTSGAVPLSSILTRHLASLSFVLGMVLMRLLCNNGAKKTIISSSRP